MPAFPEPPLIRRSWLTRAHFSPSHWAKGGAALLYDTLVTFTRDTLVTDGSGGFAPASGPGPGATAVWAAVPAHVELAVDSGLLIGEPPVGPIRRRHYLIICDLPADTAQLPKPQDYVAWTDETGVAHKWRVQKADSPEGDADHLEIETESFE